MKYSIYLSIFIYKPLLVNGGGLNMRVAYTIVTVQAALPTGLIQPLIIEGEDKSWQRQRSPTPVANYIKIQGGGSGQSAQHYHKGNNRYIKVSG